jgi:CheY-like chemotaxis protein
MMSATPPPRQQVLYGIRIQAEQARNLVEDLQAGSDTAPADLLNVASQILARARMYKWPRLTIWASALEERLTKAVRAQVVTTQDLQWFEAHVERLDAVIEFPSGVAGSADTPGGENAPSAEPEAHGREPAPPGDGPAPRSAVEIARASLRAAFEDVDLSLEVPMTPRPGSFEIDLGDLEGEWADGDEMLPLDAASESDPVPDPDDNPADLAPETPAPGGEVDAGGHDGAAAQGSPASDSVDTTRDEAAQAEPAADERPDTAEPERPREDDEALLGAMRSRSASETEGETGDDDERASQADADGKATIGRLDIQRRRSSTTLTSTEIQGPNQYTVVSVAGEQDLHLFLGRALPERRFELLTARSPAEAESVCLEHQPDLLLVAWDPTSDMAQQVLERIRQNPLTRYVRVALVPQAEDLASHLAATRLDAIGIVPRSAEAKTVASRVLLCVLSSGRVSGDDVHETSMGELSDLLLRELKNELTVIQGVVGDVVVPVGDVLGQTLRDTSVMLRDGVKRALGADDAPGPGARPAAAEDATVLLAGRRAVLMEADRLRRTELARVLAEMGLEVLPPMPDITKALEAGLAWAPDVFVGGAPTRDATTCVDVLRRDIALSSMAAVIVRWPDSDRQWPDAVADVATLRPVLAQQLAEAFAPVAELGRQLATSDEVTGRIESCGMLALFQLVLSKRPRALLETAEGTDQFKAMIADGRVLDAIWVEGDGTMTAHFDAFARMLAAKTGRFFVRPLEGEDTPNLNLPGSLTELLTAACHWWRPLGLKIDQRLADIGPIDIDRRRATELKRQAGKVVREVVSELSRGKSPQQVIEAKTASRTVVAHALRELVRRFAVRELPLIART